MFLFKKIVSQFFLPLPLCLAVCFIGLALLWWTNRQRTGRALVSVGLLTLLSLSCDPIAEALLAPLENQYPPYVYRDSSRARFVVVLGGGHASHPEKPLSSQLSCESVKRLVEAIRIYRANRGSKLLLSGGNCFDPSPDAQLLSATAQSVGVPKEDIVLEDQSMDTADEARLIGPMVGTNAFILVTSANHMPRSMALFRSRGLEPIPASADHQLNAARLQPASCFPNGASLRKSEHAFYEYMGLCWTALTRSP